MQLNQKFIQIMLNFTNKKKIKNITKEKKGECADLFAAFTQKLLRLIFGGVAVSSPGHSILYLMLSNCCA